MRPTSWLRILSTRVRPRRQATGRDTRASLRLEVLEDRELFAVITTLAGNGNSGSGGDTGPATSAQLNTPIGVAVDANGSVYLADSVNNRIRIVTPSGMMSTINTFAGSGVRNPVNEGVRATSANLFGPTGVAVDANNNVYIADFGHALVRRVTPAPNFILNTYAGGGTAGLGDGLPATAASLKGPTAVAVDAAGNLFIADVNDQRIRKVNPQGIISTVAGNGNMGFSGDGGPASRAALGDPFGIAVDASGDLFIADSANNRIRKVTPDGIISTIAGTGGGGFGGDGGPATSAQLDTPLGVAVDASGNVFITDDGNARIREVVQATGIIRTVAGNGTPGPAGDGGPATSAQLNFPYGVAVDANGTVYFADQNNERIRVLLPMISVNGGNSQTAAAGTRVATSPSVLVTDVSGNPRPGLTVTFTVTSGGGSVTGASAVSDAAGIATVGSWTLGMTPGSNTLTATAVAPGVMGSTVTFTATAIASMPASLTLNNGNGQTQPVGTPVPIRPSVRVTDAFNNPVPGVTVTFTVAFGGGSVTGGSATSNANGVATVGSWTLGTTPGSNTLTASVTGVANPGTFTALAIIGSPSKLEFATQPSTVVPGEVITPAVIVLVEDAFGNIVTTDNSLVTIDLGKNPGASILGGNRQANVVNGRATFNTLFLTALGSGYNLVASDGALQRLPSLDFNVKPVSLTASTNLALVGQPVTFTFQAFALVPFQGNPFGSATFSLGSTVLGTVPVNSDGLASFTTVLPQSAAGGPSIITAAYNDPDDDSTAVTVVATTGLGIPVTVVLGAGASGIAATLADGAPAGTLAGTLQSNVPTVGQFQPASYTMPPNFGDNNLFSITAGSSATSMNLVTTFTAAFASRHSYTVKVLSDIGAGTPAVAIFTLFVAPSAASSPARTSTTLTSSLNPAPTVGQAVTFTATVRASAGTPNGPVENVLFLADGNPLGVVSLTNGVATLTLSTLAMGNHPVAAIYAGDGTFISSTSNTFTQTIGRVQSGSNISVYDPQSSTFYLRNDKSSGAADAGSYLYGLQNWEPVTGVWTGSKKTTIGIVDPSGLRDVVNHRDAFWFLGSGNGVNDIPGFAYGYASWTPISGNWNGSGRFGIGVFDPATATFYLRNETSGGAPDAGAFQFGAPGWIPLAGDWTGNGKFGIGVFDPTTATFYLRNELSGGAPDAGVFQFGLPNWKPVVGDWNGDGKWTIGVVDPSGARDTVNHRDAFWFLSDDNRSVTYTPFAYGFAAWTPLAGVWNPPPGSPMAAVGVVPVTIGPMLDPYAVAQLARAEGRHSDVLDSLFAASR